MPELNSTTEQSLDLREELNKYLRYWPWFILSLLILLILAYTYLRYETTVYSTFSTILIKDDNSASSELIALEELGITPSGSGNSMANEIGILKSRGLMVNVVKALDLNIIYTAPGNVKDVELYTNAPVKINMVQFDPEHFNGLPAKARSFKVSRKPSGGLEFYNEFTGKRITGNLESPIDLGFAIVVVMGSEAAAANAAFDVTISFSSYEQAANKYRANLGIQLTDKTASLLQLSMQDNVPQKARDILDQLVVEYNKDAIEDDNLVAKTTGEFIEERLDIILADLDDVEGDIENFKEERRITSIESEAELFLESSKSFETQRREVGIQLELIQLMIEFVQNADNAKLLPANMGIEESSVNTGIQEYNTLVQERNRILRGSSEENPVVLRMNSEISTARENILQSLLTLRNTFRLTAQDLSRQAAQIDNEIREVPANERQYRVKARQQGIKEELYLFLLQKREENALKAAISVPKAKVIDAPYGAQVVSPNRRSVYLGAILAGLLIPFGVIYIGRLLNNKIERREDIEKVTRSIPIVGELPRISKGESDLIEENDRSVLAESFRIMTTNLQYLLVNAKHEDKGYCLYTTSTVKGEGKTFTSINLAVTLANTGKKVVLIGADLRNPQLQRYDTESKSFLGVSDYLVNDDHSLKTLIRASKFHPKLHLLLSGSIPPNPSELLRQAKFGQMIEELRAQYDYVIVDTAPSMLVADTFLISKYADLILYMTRAGYTEKKLLNFAVDAQNDGKLHDISFVINDVTTANFGYGNKYGYAYGQEKPSLWERFKKSF